MVHPIDVAISYASEQGEYVEKFAKSLKRLGVITFYYPFEKEQIVGEDLLLYLERVYRDWATLCVMFISADYVRKAWPGHERRAALSRQLRESVYIIPIRFDMSEVPGLGDSVAYLRAKDYSEYELAKIVRDRLLGAKSGKVQSSS